MRNAILTTFIAAAAVAIAGLTYDAHAQDKKAPVKKPPACNALKDEAACKGRNDCNWVAESKDDKGKVKRRAYCRANPTPKKDDKKK